MKKYLYLIAFILVGITTTSCDKNDGAYYPVPSDFSVSPQTEQSFTKDGGTVVLTIKAGNLGWSIASSQAWCKASAGYGSGDAEVTLTVEANESGEARTSEVVITPTFNQPAVKITIRQQ